MTVGKCFTATLRQCCTNIACAPFFMLAIAFYAFYYCWPYSAQLPYQLGATIVDEDNSPLSRRLIMELRADPRLNVKYVRADRQTAIYEMQAEKVVTIIGIPKNFERDVLQGTPIAMTLITNGAFIVKARSSISGASAPLQELASKIIAGHLAANGIPNADIALISMQAPAFIIAPMFNQISGYLNFVAPIVFMIIIQTLMLCGTGMLFNSWFTAKKMPGILKLVLASPARLFAVQGPIFLISFIWTLIIEGGIFAMHGVNSFQNFYATICMGLSFAFAVSSLGILIGLLLGPTWYVIQAIVASSLPCVFISGNLWPMQNMPIYMQALSWIFPGTPAAAGMMRASQAGANLLEITPYLLHLLELGMIYLVLALLTARWRNKSLAAA